MLKRVLVANRGEIALRVIRACRDLGIESVAVYSEADRYFPFVRAADFAFPIGASQAARSYLSVERILTAARESGADAIHPGYGFLAENAEFAAQVLAAGLIWVGPPPSAIRAMGDKLAARQLMQKAGVPVTPGLYTEAQEGKAVAEACAKLGYPVLIKAASGGGGKGMRMVHDATDLAPQLALAQSEASKAFSDGRVYVEKYIARSRHVEIQVMADSQGTVVHLGERECSIQRRHQKIIEESPSPAVNEKLRQEMGAAAVRAARECGYVGAGTVEFLVDPSEASGAYYFLEMNTRLQVEHPVTECVTGRDLVAMQLSVAAGEPLGFTQSDVQMAGHAFECRIYAEDPDSNFMPSVGKLSCYREPAGPGVRVDSGVEEGLEVSLHYDPQLAKLITWGATREVARARMRRALGEYRLSGVKHNLALLSRVFDHPAFVAGELSTHFLVDHDLLSPSPLTQGSTLATVVAAALSAAAAIDAQPGEEIDGSSAGQHVSTRRNRSLWRQSGRLQSLREGGRVRSSQ